MKPLILSLLFWVPSCAFSQEIFKVEEVDLGIDVVQQVTPEIGSTNIFRLDSTNGMVVTDIARQWGYAGPCIRLSWNSVSNVVYIIRWSTNNVEWHQIPVEIEGNGKTRLWYSNSLGPTNYFQLVKIFIPQTVPKSPPKNLRIVERIQLRFGEFGFGR